MPSCMNCGNESFDAQNGLFYCEECGTQSQDVRVEMFDEEPNNEMNQTLQLKRKDGCSKGRRRREIDQGKPWVSYEGIQCILKAQVEALIKLGVDQSLKDVVGNFWFTFLKKSGVSYQSFQNKSKLFGSCWKRDHSFTDKKVLPPSIRKRNTKKKKADAMTGNDVTKAKETSVDLPESSAQPTSHSVILERVVNDNEISTHNSDKESSSQETSPLELVFNNQIDKEAFIIPVKQELNGAIKNGTDNQNSVGSIDADLRTSFHGAKHISQMHSIALCYLGLLWIRELVTLSDLLRWIREGQLPYHNSSEILPQHMKFSGRDFYLLCSRHSLTVDGVCDAAEGIAKVIGLKSFPPQHNNVLAMRLMMDFDMKPGVNIIVQRLLNDSGLPGVYIPTLYSSSLHIEEIIAAHIIIALKIIYGLDDVQETSSNPNASVFGLNDNALEPWLHWINRVLTMEENNSKTAIPRSLNDVFKQKDCTRYTNHCTNNIFKLYQPRDTTPLYVRQGRHAGIACTSEKRVEYLELFSNACDLSTSNNKQFNQSSFPFGHKRMEPFDDPSISYDHEVETQSSSIGSRSDDDVLTMNDELDYRYVMYTNSDVNKEAYHHSYSTLLGLFARRLETTAESMHRHVLIVEKVALRAQKKWLYRESLKC